MKKSFVTTFAVLMALTAATALLSGSNGTHIFWPAAIILLLSAVKFSLVTFQFMELKEAHIAWRIVMVALLIIIILGLVIVRMQIR